jgi:hypothetical protein
MRGILVAVILVVVVFFAVPMVSQGTTSTCQALERKTVSDTATNIGGSTGVVHNVINSVGQAGATGDVANQTAAAEHPDSPSPVTCTVEYWQKLI